jgi:hypothetical protein
MEYGGKSDGYIEGSPSYKDILGIKIEVMSSDQYFLRACTPI